jgi:hypothetical protein
VKHVSPPLHSNSTFKTYNTTEKGQRGFCSTCGSSLTFQFIADPEDIELHVGTIDEDDLVGKKVGEEDTGEHGFKSTREGGLGALLCQLESSGSIYMENAMPGYTQNIPGPLWWRERQNAKPFRSTGGALLK